MSETSLGDFVLATTEHRGVFAGELVDNNKDRRAVTLKDVRNCVYWHNMVHGVFGLAFSGPNSKCRIGPAVPELTITGVTSLGKCTDEAKAAWEKEPWGN